MEDNTELLTSDEWEQRIQRKYPKFAILDPDGWDRSPENYQFSFYEEKIDSAEFFKRLVISTCQWERLMFDDKNWFAL